MQRNNHREKGEEKMYSDILCIANHKERTVYSLYRIQETDKIDSDSFDSLFITADSRMTVGNNSRN